MSKFHPHLYGIRVSHQTNRRPDFEPSQNRGRESRERVSLYSLPGKRRGERRRGQEIALIV